MAGYRKRRGRGRPRSARQRAALRKAQLVSAKKRKKSGTARTVAKAAGAVVAAGVATKLSYYAFHPNGFKGFKSDLKDAREGYAAVKGWLGKGPKTSSVTAPISNKPKMINPYRIKPRHTHTGKRRRSRVGY